MIENAEDYNCHLYSAERCHRFALRISVMNEKVAEREVGGS
jgi:hypothetical protein